MEGIFLHCFHGSDQGLVWRSSMPSLGPVFLELERNPSARRRANDNMESMSQKQKQDKKRTEGAKKRRKGTGSHVNFCKPLPAFLPPPSLALTSLVHDILATFLCSLLPAAHQWRASSQKEQKNAERA